MFMHALDYFAFECYFCFRKGMSMKKILKFFGDVVRFFFYTFIATLIAGIVVRGMLRNLLQKMRG
jgi:hypothetical protein